MRTTIEILDDLLARTREVAKLEGTTLRALVEEGLVDRPDPARAEDVLQWPDLSVEGEGLDPEIEEGGWGPLRGRIYAIPSLEPMDKKKRGRLEAKGWKVGLAEEYLGLAPEEATDIDLRLKRSNAACEPRRKARIRFNPAEAPSFDSKAGNEIRGVAEGYSTTLRRQTGQKYDRWLDERQSSGSEE